MDLQKLFEIQAGLDFHIEKEHPVQEGEDRLAKKILALRVEVGELANELPEVFKFWSNKKNNYENALKEYADGLHFLLSIGLTLGFDKDFEPHLVKVYEPLKMLSIVFYYITDFECVVGRYNKNTAYGELFSWYLGLGKSLGFTWEQIEESYFEKNRINHERQNSGY